MRAKGQRRAQIVQNSGIAHRTPVAVRRRPSPTQPQTMPCHRDGWEAAGWWMLRWYSGLIYLPTDAAAGQLRGAGVRRRVPGAGNPASGKPEWSFG